MEHCEEQSQEVVQGGYCGVWQLAVVIIGPLLEAIFRAIHLGLLLGTARPQAVLWELDPFVQDDEHCEKRYGTVGSQAVLRELGPVSQLGKVDVSCTSSAHHGGCRLPSLGVSRQRSAMNWDLETKSRWQPTPRLC